MDNNYLKDRFYGDVFWIILRRFSTRIINFISTVILARILAPSDFGLFGFAIVVINFLILFKDLGTSSAIIYHDERTEPMAGTMLTINFIMGLVLFSMAQVIAPFIGHFFKDPGAVLFLRLLSFVFIITAFGTPQESLLRKELFFKRMVLSQIFACFLGGLFSISLAFLGAGALSLVSRNLLTVFFTASFLWIVSPWRIRFSFNKDIAKKLLSYGMYIQIGLLIGFAVTNVDYVVVGRILGKNSLGLYLLAFNTCFLILGTFSLVAHNVMFPVFSKLKGNRDLLNAQILKGFQFLSLILLPAGIGLAVVGPSFTLSFYGSKWKDMILPFIFLSGYATLRSLFAIFFEGMRALGIVRLLACVAFIKLILLVPVLILATAYGITGVALTHLCFGCIGILVDLLIIKKILNIEITRVLSKLKLPAMSCCIMIGGLVIMRNVYSTPFHVFNLILEVSCGIVFYGLGLLVCLKVFKLDKELYVTLNHYLAKLWKTVRLRSQ